MSRYADQARSLRLDPESQSGGYFRHAVYNHWDPYEDIPESLIEQDRTRLMEADDDEISEAAFDDMRQSLALFGAGEEAVTEDLAPLMLALDDIDDQTFISSQIYEEAKHTQFFDRYWRDVINPVAEHHGMEVTAPTDERYFMPEYEALFDGTEEAMHKLLEPGQDTPENRVRAYCHYHLTVESVLAQTGYYGLTNALSDSNVDITMPEAPDLELDALVEGISYIRSDEGRHVGFGMHKVQQHLAEDDVDEQVVRSTLQELMPHVAGIVSYSDELVDPIPLVEYARDKLTRRIEIITNEHAEIPGVEELVKLDDGSDTNAAASDD
jgi:ribonucleoside-diphosphate reductase beta chain